MLLAAKVALLAQPQAPSWVFPGSATYHTESPGFEVVRVALLYEASRGAAASQLPKSALCGTVQKKS